MMEWGLTDAFDKLSDSDENHINPSDNLTPKNAEPDKEIFNVSNDTPQKIYLEELD